jgi:hypothetical protein
MFDEIDDVEVTEENDWLDDQADELNEAFGDIVIDIE